MIKIHHRGNFKRTEKFLSRASIRDKVRPILELYAAKGVAVLASATPIDTGKTASSWDYELLITNTGYRINWVNTNVNDGVSVAVLIQYGHGTQNGSYIEGRDFINPAITPIMDAIAKNLWEEVSKL